LSTRYAILTLNRLLTQVLRFYCHAAGNKRCTQEELVMELFSHILFYSLVLTLGITMLLSLLHDEVMNVVWIVYDSVTHSLSFFKDQLSR